MSHQKKRVREEDFGKVEYDHESDTFKAYSHLSREETLECMLKAPLTLHWVLTMKCNARCPYCYELDHLLKPSDNEATLPGESISKFIKEYSKLGGFRLYLTGGEPTLSESLPFVIEQCHEYNVSCVINTNGLRIPPKLYQIIRYNDARLSFSLDSHIREEHDKARRQKSYDSIMSILDRCAIDRVKTRVVSVMPNEDKDLSYWADFGKLLDEKHVNTWFLQPLSDAATSTERLMSIQDALQQHLKLRVRVLPAIFPTVLYILPNGDVASRLWTKEQVAHGNITQKPFEEIWAGYTGRQVKCYEGILHMQYGRSQS